MQKVPTPRKQLAMRNQPRKKLKAQKRAIVQETQAPRKVEVTKKGRVQRELL